MADPLSIATGILTFMGACNTLVSTIKKLHQLRQAPRELEELENEISSLRTYTEGLNRLVEMRNVNDKKAIDLLFLGSQIDSARWKIQEIRHFLEGSLLDPSSSIKIRSSAWLKWQSEFNRLRQELRDVRLEIGTCIGLFTA